MAELPRQSDGAAPVRYSWSQPTCVDCWDSKNPHNPAIRGFELGEPETCAWCGLETRSGIYVREDPDAVPFPAVRDD